MPLYNVFNRFVNPLSKFKKFITDDLTPEFHDDEIAVHAAYTAHGSELYRFVLRGLGDPGAAQDVVQEVFLRAWRAAGRLPAIASKHGRSETAAPRPAGRATVRAKAGNPPRIKATR